MDTLLLDPTKFARLYNCSLHPPDQIPLARRQQPVLGTIYLSLGLILELLYLPCMLAIWRHLREPSYKIMFFIGIADLCCLPIIGCMHGWFGIQGAVFCSHPLLIYLCGCFVQQLWAWEAFSAILLGVNRCLEIAFPAGAQALFHGQRTWLLLCIPAVYSTYFGWFNMPILFTSLHMVWVINPFNEYAPDNRELYHNPMHVVNNIFVLCTLTSLYALVALLLCYKICMLHGNSSQQLRAQKMPFLQVLVLSIFHINASGVYIYIQYNVADEWVIQAAMLGWFFAHGCPPVVYLSMNKTIRTECLQMIRRRQPQVGATTAGGQLRTSGGQKQKLSNGNGHRNNNKNNAEAAIAIQCPPATFTRSATAIGRQFGQNVN